MSDSSKALRQWVEAQWPELSLSDFSNKASLAGTAGEKSSTAVRERDPPPWQALAGDAGGRQYFRLKSEPPLLAVFAPPESEKNAEFVAIGRILRNAGVLAPAIAACDLERGYFLLEDFGPDLFLDRVDSDNAERLYRDAISTLVAIQRSCVDESVLETYDRRKLRAEMELFPEWFAQGLLGFQFGDRDRAIVEETFTGLEAAAVAQPQVLVHRDYHSRNLVVRPDGPLGVIDFQDAVIGPLTYDLVSLLRDCYIQWPAERLSAWLDHYLSEARGVLPEDIDREQFIRWFDWMGLQRHLKVLGIFARLHLRDGKPRYLDDLPLVVHYTLAAAGRYPELANFRLWFEAELLPRVRSQAWWRNLTL